MMTWNYRIIKKDECFFIHEVYYDEDGEIEAFTDNATYPMGETVEELENDIGYFKKALSLPILDYEEIEKFVTKDRKKKKVIKLQKL